MSHRVQFSDLTLMLPPGWLDITHDLPAGSPPTLAKEDGVGVIQFSVARYMSGIRPDIDDQALESMLEEFGGKEGLGKPGQIVHGQGQQGIRFVTREYLRHDERIVAWYVTNRKDVAMITYVTQMPNDPRAIKEFIDASAVVKTLDFIQLTR